MGAAHSAEGEGGAYASEPTARIRRKSHTKRRRHSVDSVASYSSQNHVDRIRTQNFSATSSQDENDFGSIKTCLFRRSSSNLDCHYKRPESVISNTSSTRSRLREFVERKSSQEETKPAVNSINEIQYLQNPTETFEFNQCVHNSLENKNNREERPKKRKLPKIKEKDACDSISKKQEKYQSKLADYYKLPIQLPQDEFYQHLTRSKAAEELLQKRFSNSDTEFNGSYGRLRKSKENESCNLRRSRSLAVIREETFTDLQIQNNSKNKRSQLIPRARLFDKPCFKDRLPSRAKYQSKEEILEGIYIESTASCFGDINGQIERTTPRPDSQHKSDRQSHSRNDSNHSKSLSGSSTNLEEVNLDEDGKENINSEESTSCSRNPSEFDSLDSNYAKKRYNFEFQQNNSKDDSCDVERSVHTPDNTKPKHYSSITARAKDKEKEENNISNNSTNNSLTQTESEEDIQHVNSLCQYDQISVRSVDSDSIAKKEETITKIVNFAAESADSENESTILSQPDSITSYISIVSSTNKSRKLEYLAHSLAEKIDEYCESKLKENSSVTPHSTDSGNSNSEKPFNTPIDKKIFTQHKTKDYIASKENRESQFSEINNNHKHYSPITYVDSTNNLFSSNNLTKRPLVENQYYSLPDINISKCLRKSERIDAQLRQEDREDIQCRTSCAIADNQWRQILSSEGTESYGQLIRPTEIEKENNLVQKRLSVCVPEKKSELLHSFDTLEDDLKSIITTESSNGDENDVIFYDYDVQQNERELNEIEGTIRNNKVIIKSDKVNLNSLSKNQPLNYISQSNDNIPLHLKKRSGIKKHYSLRQRDPKHAEEDRLQSPSTVEEDFTKINSPNLAGVNEDIKSKHTLISRVQSFKTSSDANISIVPLSGHQTIVIDSLKDNLPEKVKYKLPEERKNLTPTTIQRTTETNTPHTHISGKNTDLTGTSKKSIDAIDPFINFKLNKIVKTKIPQLEKKIPDIKNSSINQEPPKRLIIRSFTNTIDNYIQSSPLSTVDDMMTRPQVLHVIDSKNKKDNTILNIANDTGTTTQFNKIQSSPVLKIETDKDKLNDAVKTDMEYQEKIHSVKNYWSKLNDKTENEHKSEENLQEIQGNTEISCGKFEKDTVVEKKSLPDISVGNIIKTLESIKIVDSIRKLSNSKLQLWKDDMEKVKSDSEIEETAIEMKIKDTEGNVYDKPKENNLESALESCRDTPEIEIVELNSDNNDSKKTKATLIKPKGFDKECEEFDHVRYKVMKSELFKNSIIANYRKEAQFDGLLQYLQDYSFQELLVNNNIVIIEPVRTKIEPAPRKNTDPCKITPTLLKKHESIDRPNEKSKNSVRRHFFYHPVRVNKEIIEEELPNPDTVKKVRNLFEETLKMKSPMTHDPPLIDETSAFKRRAASYRNLNEDVKNKEGGRRRIIRQLTIDTNFGNKKWDNASLSSGVSSGDLSSNNEFETERFSPFSHKNVCSSSDEYLCESVKDFCCESQYVSPDILKKIRDCGTTVTYYGGKVMNAITGSAVSPMTKAIMDEIKGLQKNCSRDCYSCQTKCLGDECACLLNNKDKQKTITEKQITNKNFKPENIENKFTRENLAGFKFKLIKSNSCSSRLELTGTNDKKTRFDNSSKISHIKSQDPPLLYDENNSVKNKIYRLESYKKGTVTTPFQNKDNDRIAIVKPSQEVFTENKKTEYTKLQEKEVRNIPEKLIFGSNDITVLSEKSTPDTQTFENKFYYVNDDLNKTKSTTGKFGEMVFEEFEVLESCYDSLNSNK